MQPKVTECQREHKVRCVTPLRWLRFKIFCVPTDPAGEPLLMTVDVYLNATAYWKNVQLPVWNFTIGGYQVMKKWLSYREEKLLGRALTLDELDYVTAMARRLAALVSLQTQLDENYRAVTTNGYAWKRVGAVGGTGLG